jgi:hypothetical protein
MIGLGTPGHALNITHANRVVIIYSMSCLLVIGSLISALAVQPVMLFFGQTLSGAGCWSIHAAAWHMAVDSGGNRAWVAYAVLLVLSIPALLLVGVIA